MTGLEMLEALDTLNPAYIEEADDMPQVKKIYPIKRWCAIAACLALLISAGMGTYAYAADAREYKAAMQFFGEYTLPTEGLTRDEIKAVYRDITNEEFTYEKTAAVIENSLTPEQKTEYNVSVGSSSANKTENLWLFFKSRWNSASTTEPTKPVDPTDPVKPTDPTDPAKPTDPTDPIKPTEPTAPTEPILPEKLESKPVTKDDFQKLFEENYWYSRVLNITFGKPDDIAAEYFFNNGLAPEDRIPYSTLTKEEIDWAFKYSSDNSTRHKLPVAKIIDALSLFGVTISDVYLPSGWVYNQSTNAYYFSTVKDYSIRSFEVTDVVYKDNNIVLIYWKTDKTYLYTNNNIIDFDGAEMVITLKDHGDRFTVVSNLPAEPEKAAGKPMTAEDFTQFMGHYSNSYYYRDVVNCTFEKPEDINLYYYFANQNSSPMTKEEFERIDKLFVQKFHYTPISGYNKLTKDALSKALSILGVTADEVVIPDRWLYDSATDAYYYEEFGFFIEGKIFTEVIHNTDGTVLVYWETSKHFLNTATGEYFRNGVKMVMTLKDQGTHYTVLSNVPVK